MNERYDNEEKFGKVVGRRRNPPTMGSSNVRSIADAIQSRKNYGGLNVPKGVFKFKTHEEADEWLIRMISRPRT